MLLSSLAREAPFCSGQQLANVGLITGPRAENKWSWDFRSKMGHLPQVFTPKAQSILQKGRQRECKIQRVGRSAVECCPLVTTGPPHSWTHSSVVTLMRPKEDQARENSSTVEAVTHRLVSLLAKELLVSGEAEAFFLASVTTSRLLVLQWMTLYPDACGLHELGPIGF